MTPDGGRYMGYSLTTDRYHFVAWRTWDNQTGQAGEVVAHELYDLYEDAYENRNIYEEADEKLINQLTRQLHEGWRSAGPRERL